MIDMVNSYIHIRNHTFEGYVGKTFALARITTHKAGRIIRICHCGHMCTMGVELCCNCEQMHDPCALCEASYDSIS